MSKRESWTVTHPHAAGIDVGAYSHYVAVPPDAVEMADTPVRQFNCHTGALELLAQWLIDCGVTTVALESTGVYWIPLFEVLEARGLDVWLVNARSVRHVSGRKSDVLDCQWLQQLHCFGLLQRAFRPDASVCAVREIVRLRMGVIEERARHVQRMQKAMVQMNVQLSSVIKDIAGESGLAIIRAILRGERDPHALAALCNYRVKASKKEVADSVQGTWKAEHLFCLAHEFKCFEFLTLQIKDIDVRIEQELGALGVQNVAVETQPNKGRAKNAPKFPVRQALMNWSKVDLTTVPGIDAGTALTILGELGPNLHRFESPKRFCSWLGLCPGTHITGGKRISGQSKRLPNRVSQALKLAAQGLSRAHCAMGAYYRTMSLRMGTSKAITAVAHKLARTIYAMLKGEEQYSDERMQSNQARYSARVLKSMRRRAAQMGYELVPSANPAVCA